MSTVKQIPISAFDYELPDANIAKYPLAARDQSKLLVHKDGQSHVQAFQDLPKLIPTDSVLLFNNTKVIHARMEFRKATGARIEIFCLEPQEPSDYNLVFQAQKQVSWKCIIGNAKKWKSGQLQLWVEALQTTLFAEKIASQQGEATVRFEWDSEKTFGEILEAIGNIPIPPYLNRQAESLDTERYQTIYSKQKGSVAAPTAGLHFTPAVFEQFDKLGIQRLELTLHVGAGTFKPVKSSEIGQHDMHTEHFSVRLDVLKQLQAKAGKIIPVGTTSLRTLESIYWLGVLCLQNPSMKPTDFFVPQWVPYETREEIPAPAAIEALIQCLQREGLNSAEARTQIMIVPSYTFRMIRALITNFHQPQSTLLLLVSAIVGDAWRPMYEFAIENQFRFLSYGDSSILFLPEMQQ